MRWYSGIGILLLSMVVFTSPGRAAQTDNLLSNDFMDDWSGTNDHYHGRNILAGVHNEYKEQTITLSDHLTVPEIQGGFTSTFEAEVWHWNSFSQETTLTQTIESATGDTVNQTVTMDHTCNNWNGCGYIDSPENIIVIPSNNVLDYDITARFDFSVPQRTSGHYGADIRNPSLIIDYEEFTIDNQIFDDLNTTFFDIENDLDFDFDFEVMTFEEPLIFTESTLIPLTGFDDGLTFFEYEEVIELEEEMDVDTPFLFLGDATDFFEEEPEFYETEELTVIEMVEESPTEQEESVDTEEISEETDFVEETTEEMVAEEEMAVVSTEELDESSVDTVEVVKDTNIVVQASVGDLEGIDKYLAENLAKMEQIVANEPKIEDKPFYIDYGIYKEQVSMADNRQLYQNVTFQVFDPVIEYEQKLNENYYKQQELKIKLERLNGID